MSPRFLDNLSFASLIAPMSREEFVADYWEQRPLIVHRNDPDYYDDLFTLRDFDEAISRSPGHIKLASAVPGKGTTWKFPTVGGLEEMLAGMREGGTLILEKLQLREPKLALLCRVLEQELSHAFETDLFLTPPNGKSSVPHWDNTDGFMLQVRGAKRWAIERERRIFPIRPGKMADDDRELRGAVTSFTVRQGDLIYIPRGFIHVAECGTEASLHINLGLIPVVMGDVLNAIIRAAVLRDENLRAALPLGFMERCQQAVIDRAASAFREAMDKDFLAATFDQYRDELTKTYHLDASGQVADFFEQRPLALDDRVGPRPGVVYRMHPAEDSVRINFGTRSITFPGFFRDALEYALSIPAFAIREIPGELEDEERIVFIERLMLEGLVVRKDAATGSA